MSRSACTSGAAGQNDDGQTDELPGEWEFVDDEELTYQEFAAFEHPSGLRVAVERDQWPDQMADARTSRPDQGFAARVTEDVQAPLTYDQTSRGQAEQAAREFVATYAEGEFDVPAPADQPYGRPVDWRVE